MMMIGTAKLCPKCGAEIPNDAPEGGCPGCLLESALRLLDDEAVVLHGRDDRGADEGVRPGENSSEDGSDSLVPADGRFGIYEIEQRPSKAQQR